MEAEYLLMSAAEEIKLTRTGISYNIVSDKTVKQLHRNSYAFVIATLLRVLLLMLDYCFYGVIVDYLLSVITSNTDCLLYCCSST